MATKSNVKRVLTAALAKLMKYGWLKDQSGSRKVGYCMTGAINASTRSVPLRLEATEALYAALPPSEQERLARVSGFGLTRIQNFNDAPERRKQTILATYRRAIKQAV